MKTAALAGLDVRVMIAPRGAEFSPAYRAARTYAADMVRAGVQVWLYQGAYFHAKTICVDSTVCSIGSANIDIRSFSINYETNLVDLRRLAHARTGGRLSGRSDSLRAVLRRRGTRPAAPFDALWIRPCGSVHR